MNQPDSRINYQYLFKVLPDPVVLIDRNGAILDINSAAKDLFHSISVGGKIENLFIEKRRIKENILDLLRFHKIIVDKAILYINNASTQTFEYKITILSEINDFYLITFNDLSVKNELLRLEIEQTLGAELHTLKPYLNKAGKELVDKRMAVKHINSNTLNFNTNEIIQPKIKQKIQSLFPQLSSNELNLAYLISLGATVNQISQITNKNSNAVRVMLHRMVARTAFNSASEIANFIKQQIDN